ncbi:MAG: hypothetical protein MR669_03095 [Selenomonadaceae bacterium]|nr:hypothetical protein [Selenomonadaceae bacterium]
MKKLLLLLVMAFVVGVGLLTAAGVSEASDDAVVTYAVDDVSVDGDYVVLKGHFHNETENFQRVKRLNLSYQVVDEDGYIILTGNEVEENINLEIGGENTPFTVRSKNVDAILHQTSDCANWKIQAKVAVDA